MKSGPTAYRRPSVPSRDPWEAGRVFFAMVSFSMQLPFARVFANLCVFFLLVLLSSKLARSNKIFFARDCSVIGVGLTMVQGNLSLVISCLLSRGEKGQWSCNPGLFGWFGLNWFYWANGKPPQTTHPNHQSGPSREPWAWRRK